jgi:septal ring factor EnvC (AmiA/AmiB activator)
MHPSPPFQEVGSASAAQLQQEVDDLRSQVAQLRADLDELATALRRTEDDLQRLRGELGA